MKDLIGIVESAGTHIPAELQPLAKEIRGRSYDAAKRILVSKTGSIRRGEKFADDVADAVFLRIQRNAQVGQYTSEREIERLGRNARRLDGDGTITLYRAAPKGAGIRPGDFTTDSRNEAGFYRHGRHVIQMASVPRRDVLRVDGSMGGAQEYIYLPVGYQAPTPVVHFQSFRQFYDAVLSS